MKVKMSSSGQEAKELKIGGTYEHYKGNRYKIIIIARHAETLGGACCLPRS